MSEVFCLQRCLVDEWSSVVPFSCVACKIDVLGGARGAGRTLAVAWSTTPEFGALECWDAFPGQGFEQLTGSNERYVTEIRRFIVLW